MPDYEIITSKQNINVILLSKLDDKKYRDEEGLFKTDGIKLFVEGYKSGLDFALIMIRESSKYALNEKLNVYDITDINSCCNKCLYVSDSVFEKISKEKSPEGLICAVKYIDKLHKIVTINERRIFFNDSPKDVTDDYGCDEKIMMLESVRDPGNLGAIIRSAYALGINRLVLSCDCADIYNPKTVRSTMGALFQMKIDRTPQLPELISVLRSKGRRVFAATLNKNAWMLKDAFLKQTDIVVIGNEGHGISQGVVESCDACLIIPMMQGAESLNAAMAATIIAWETGGFRM